jgi:hypothetical protein
MMNNRVVDKSLFSIFMNREEESNDSEIFFGGIDEEKILSEINYHNVI